MSGCAWLFGCETMVQENSDRLQKLSLTDQYSRHIADRQSHRDYEGTAFHKGREHSVTLRQHVMTLKVEACWRERLIDGYLDGRLAD